MYQNETVLPLPILRDKARMLLQKDQLWQWMKQLSLTRMRVVHYPLESSCGS